MRWFILASISFHALLLLTMKGLPDFPSPQELVEIEWSEREGPGGPRGGGKGPSLRDLTPRYGLGPSKGTPRGDDRPLGHGDWGDRAGVLEELEHFVHYDQLMREVQGMLFYPVALGLRSISGTINARLYFKEGSECDLKKSWVRGAQHFLRFFVFAIFKKLCSMEKIKHMGFKQNQYVDMSFAFILETGEPREELEKRDKIIGNTFKFERIYHKPPYEYQVGPIRGYWFAPLVYLDYPWVLDRWQQITTGRDPLDAFRER